jgi:hypothetical protein
VAEALADKYSQWDAVSGEPTHDREGAALEGKALDKARKEVEKQKKVGGAWVWVWMAGWVKGEGWRSRTRWVVRVGCWMVVGWVVA